ncbi:MAG: CHAP domain-containing protein [Candidatus Dormiibacterota bacterium]
MPTLGNYEVELRDGYVVSARDDSGSAWSSDAVVEYQFNDEGYLVFARYADGTVWVADTSPEIAEVVSELRAELEAPRTPLVTATLDRSRSALVKATNKAVFGSRDVLRRVTPGGQPVFRPSATPRVLSHLMVLGAVVVPMSFTVANANTSAMPQPRVTIPLSLDAAVAQDPTTADALHAAATTAELDLTPMPPVAAIADGKPQPPPPTPRPFAKVQAAAGSGGHFSWGWCTWYVSSRRYVPWMGNAIEWWPNARSFGFAEGSTPKVGAIMVTRESWYGHVAYVESVDPDGGFTVSEMNYKGFGVISQRHFSSVPSFVVGFIY